MFQSNIFSSNDVECYFVLLDPTTGIPMVSDPLGPGRVPHQINTNHNLMLHEQLFPAASRTTDFIIPEVTLDRLSRYFCENNKRFENLSFK